MKSPDDLQAWLEPWRRLGEGFLAGGAPGGGVAEANAAFTRFAEGYASLLRPAAGAGAGREWARYTAELRALAERFVTSAFPEWPTGPHAGNEWSRELANWSTVLGGIATDAAERFSASLGRDPPVSLRAAFDRWIDAAEAAYQAAAHSDAFIGAQARLVNAFVKERARQQDLLERGARALGLPTRREIDSLHDALRALRPAPAADAAAAPAAPAAPRAGRKAAPRARTAKPRRPRQ